MNLSVSLLNDKRSLDYVIILILHSMNHILMFSLPILILYIRDEFVLNYTQSGILWTVLIVLMTVISIIIGLFADQFRRGRYPIIYFGLLIMAIGWYFVTFATNYQQLIYIFMLIGFGASAFHPPAMAIITEMFEENKGRALSVFMMVGMISTAASPLIFAGIFALMGTWQEVAKVISFSAIGLGLIMLIITIFSGMFRRTEWDGEVDSVQVGKELSKLDLRFLFSGLIIVPLFFISIRSSFFRTSSLFTSLLYEDYLSLTKPQASIATALVLGIASFFTLIGGTISDKTRPINSIMISAVGTFIAAIGLVFLADYSDLVSFSIFYFILNAAYYTGSPATSALLADRVAPKQRGKMFGVLFSLGQVLSLATPVIFGWIKDNRGLNAAFGFILVLATIAFIIGGYIFYEERERLKDEGDMNH